MKRMKRRSDVGGSGCSESESCSIVQHFFEFGKKMLRTARQKPHSITRSQIIYGNSNSAQPLATSTFLQWFIYACKIAKEEKKWT